MSLESWWQGTMIVSRKISFGRAIQTLGNSLFSLAGWTVAVTALHYFYSESRLWISPLPFTVAGAVLSIFLAFRNNAVYDRYWEARSLWGRLVNYSRAFTRQLITYLRQGSAYRDGDGAYVAVSPRVVQDRERVIREMAYRTIAFTHALRHHLREEDAQLEINRLLCDEEIQRLITKRNVPNGILLLQGEQLALLRERQWLDSIQVAALDASLTEFANIQGSCERIKNTPLPPVYTMMADRVVFAYCGLLPFGLVSELGLVTPLLVTVISFAFLILSRIGSLLENPFGLRSNDLPLTALSRTIEIDIRQSLEESVVPAPIEPINGVLL
jgi:putative membrane protein